MFAEGLSRRHGPGGKRRDVAPIELDDADAELAMLYYLTADSLPTSKLALLGQLVDGLITRSREPASRVDLLPKTLADIRRCFTESTRSVTKRTPSATVTHVGGYGCASLTDVLALMRSMPSPLTFRMGCVTPCQ